MDDATKQLIQSRDAAIKDLVEQIYGTFQAIVIAIDMLVKLEDRVRELESKCNSKQ